MNMHRLFGLSTALQVEDWQCSDGGEQADSQTEHKQEEMEISVHNC